MKTSTQPFHLIVAMLAIICLVACAAGNMAYDAGNGNPPPIDLIVGEQPQSGQYAATNALVSYSYQLRYTYLVTGAEPSSARAMAMTGQIDQLTRGVDQLRVRVVFLDDKDRSCASHSVFSTGYKERPMNSTFEKQFDVPPQATRMIFTSNVRMSRGHK